MCKKIIRTSSLLLLFLSTMAHADLPERNMSNQSYNKAKKMLYTYVYPTNALKTTLYCQNKFNSKRQIVGVPDGFSASGNKKRFNRVEAEHVVAISNIAKHYPQYFGSHEQCVSSKGKPFKGRNCVEKTSKSFRFANSDLYLLYPANGLINLLRSNYNFAEVSGSPPSKITGCDIVIDQKNRLVEPRDEIKGVVARVHLYAANAYPVFKLSNKQQQLFDAWDRLYPITAEECRREKIIRNIQRSENPILRQRCG